MTPWRQREPLLSRVLALWGTLEPYFLPDGFMHLPGDWRERPDDDLRAFL